MGLFIIKNVTVQKSLQKLEFLYGYPVYTSDGEKFEIRKNRPPRRSNKVGVVIRKLESGEYEVYFNEYCRVKKL